MLRSLKCTSSSCCRLSTQAEAAQRMGRGAARWAAHEQHACVCQSHLLLSCLANEDIPTVQTIRKRCCRLHLQHPAQLWAATLKAPKIRFCRSGSGQHHGQEKALRLQALSARVPVWVNAAECMAERVGALTCMLGAMPTPLRMHLSWPAAVRSTNVS